MKKIIEIPFVVPSIIIGLMLLIGLWTIGKGISERGSENIISVTGSATIDATADNASWSVELERTVDSKEELAGAYKVLSTDVDAVSRLLNDQHLASSSVSESVANTSQNYNGNSYPVSYTLSETVTIQTTDVEKIDSISHNLKPFQDVISSGTIVSPQSPAYFISTLPQLRVSLVGKAVADAKARANEIAKSGGSTVGAISSASSGVVQVIAPNSTNVEDYGSYDTSTIQKQVMVTARASFYIK